MSKVIEEDELIESPKSIWVHVHAVADCRCCYHGAREDDPRFLTHYVEVDVIREIYKAIWQLDNPHVGRPGDLYSQAINGALKAIRRIASKEGINVIDEADVG